MRPLQVKRGESMGQWRRLGRAQTEKSEPNTPKVFRQQSLELELDVGELGQKPCYNNASTVVLGR